MAVFVWVARIFAEPAALKCVGILVIRANPHAGEAARALVAWCRENGIEPLYLAELSGYGIDGGVVQYDNLKGFSANPL